MVHDPWELCPEAKKGKRAEDSFNPILHMGTGTIGFRQKRLKPLYATFVFAALSLHRWINVVYSEISRLPYCLPLPSLFLCSGDVVKFSLRLSFTSEDTQPYGLQEYWERGMHRGEVLFICLRKWLCGNIRFVPNWHID